MRRVGVGGCALAVTSRSRSTSSLAIDIIDLTELSLTPRQLHDEATVYEEAEIAGHRSALLQPVHLRIELACLPPLVLGSLCDTIHRRTGSNQIENVP